VCSEHSEIPKGLVGRESQCLSMQERCVLICEVDEARGMVEAAFWPCGRLLPSGGQGWGGALRLYRSVPLRCKLETLGLVSGFAGVCEMYEGRIEASSPLRAP
jgi:hypothetical protein